MFRASDYLAAQEPWQIELPRRSGLRGRVYTARHVSQDAVLRYWGRLQMAKDYVAKRPNDQYAEAVGLRVLQRAVRALLREAFPWRPWMLWRGDPVRRLSRLPSGALQEALNDFFAYLARTSAPAMREPILASTPSVS